MQRAREVFTIERGAKKMVAEWSFPKFSEISSPIPDWWYSRIAEVCWSLVAGAPIHPILPSSAGTLMASLVWRLNRKMSK